LVTSVEGGKLTGACMQLSTAPVVPGSTTTAGKWFPRP
jgi:hypothetical protein